MTTNEGFTYRSSISPLLVAGEWSDYANISHLTDKDHRLPDWILRTISGQMRNLARNENSLKGQALGYLREMQDKRAQNEKMDVESQWRFVILCQEIGLRQVIREREYRRETNEAEKSD